MDKKTIILVVILGIFIIFYFQIMEGLGLYKPAPPTQKEPATQTEQTQQPQEDSLTVTKTTTKPTDTETLTVQDTTSTQMVAADSNVTIDTTIVETNRYVITLSSLGGGMISMKLKDYTLRDGTPIEMLPNAKEATPEMTFAGGTFTTSQLPFVADVQPGKYDVTSGNFDLTYKYVKEDGSAINRHFRFYADRYDYSLSVELVEPNKMGLSGKYSLVWNTPLGVTEPQPEIDYKEMRGVALQAGSFEKLDKFEDDIMKQSLDGTTEWVGVRSKYFAAVMIPRNREAEGAFANGYINKVETPAGMLDEKFVTAGMNMEFANVVSLADSFTVFVGPLDYNLMKQYKVKLQDILDIGTTPFIGWLIKIFAVPIMWLLPKMYNYIPNYGLVIIIFAFIVKIVTLPLSQKSFKSMSAMKEIQPKIDELKKKYAKDAQRMQQEQMKLFKEHGVNPLAGCLVMLPQMPLFFALFAVFRSTILLRDAPFVWFITDLSRGATSYTDPYMILVVIMVLAQFASQKVTMGGGAQQQNKAFTYIMPFFMGWLFHTFASGLVLYWICFSLFSLFDYVLFRRKKKNPEIKTA